MSADLGNLLQALMLATMIWFGRKVQATAETVARHEEKHISHDDKHKRHDARLGRLEEKIC